jgi:hypothetical protein
MGKPDTLSRWADHRSEQGDNDNLTLLAPELLRSTASVTADEARMVINERMKVRSRGNMKEQIPR